MHGDFALNPSDDPNLSVTRVLMQQGRPLLPSDWNASVAVTLRQLRQFIVDLIGNAAGTAGAFMPNVTSTQVFLGYGTYYVDGIRVENALAANGDPKGLLPSKQPYLANVSDAPPKGGILYLDVWERHISSAEDDGIREVALGGPDTTSRSVVIWQVRFQPMQVLPAKADAYRILNDLLRSQALLAARARHDSSEDDPCRLSPDAQYRGFENQLYRVEIHAPAGPAPDKPKFKWARDNGSNVLPIAKYPGGDTVELASLGHGGRTSVAENDWVEVVDDTSFLNGTPQPLLQVKKVDRPTMTVTLAVPQGTTTRGTDVSKHPILRRWDDTLHDVEMPTGADDFLDLADGIQVQFPSSDPADYHAGDHWMIPARTITGDVIWPKTNKVPNAVPPHGIQHHYAPLASFGATGAFTDLRFEMKKIVS